MRNFSYRDVHDLVVNCFESDSAAEAHGLLSGMLCMDAGVSRDDWLDSLSGSAEGEPNALLAEPETVLIHDVFEATRRELDDFDFSFEPLLPNDEAPLNERAVALSEWCQGFLTGLGYKDKGSNWPGECTEILNDFVEISRLDPDASGETDEAAYAELTEYVRVGVQVISSELQPGSPPQLH